MRIAALLLLLFCGQARAAELFTAPWRSDELMMLGRPELWAVLFGAVAVPAVLAFDGLGDITFCGTFLQTSANTANSNLAMMQITTSGSALRRTGRDLISATSKTAPAAPSCTRHR